VNVRLERSEDREASLAVERVAFEGPLEADIAEAVRDEKGAFALVADIGGVVVGHVQLSRAWIGGSNVVALGPIGVLPDRQGRGVGTALVGEALDEAARRGEPAVILLGAPDYYGRFGFVPGSLYGLRNPFAGETEQGFTIAEEDFQIAVLDETRASELSGEVRWHAAFG